MPYPHMPAGVFPPVTSGMQTFSVDYTATGTEGTDFDVQIGQVMADTTYSVVPANAGGTSGDGTESSGVYTPEIPNAGRGLGQFRVLIGAPLVAGDVLKFVITGNVS
jgi:hypothetical protein